MVHDLRAVCDAVVLRGARTGSSGVPFPVDFPPWEAVYAFLRAVERPRRCPGAAGRAAARTCCASDGAGTARAVGLRDRLPDGEVRATPSQEVHQRLPRRQEGDRPRAARRGGHRGLAARPGRRGGLGQRQGRREAPAHQAVRRLRHPEAHVGRHAATTAGRWRSTPRLVAAITVEVVGPDQPALLPGTAPPLGGGADVRLADALQAPRPRLRAPPLSTTRPWSGGPPSSS